MLPAVNLQKSEERADVTRRLGAGELVFIYFDARLGGELSIPPTARSPEFSFDVTVVELVARAGVPHVGRFGILEIQTMDFHGSYRAAVRNLRECLRMHADEFGPTLQEHGRDTGRQGLPGGTPGGRGIRQRRAAPAAGFGLGRPLDIAGLQIERRQGRAEAERSRRQQHVLHRRVDLRLSNHQQFDARSSTAQSDPDAPSRAHARYSIRLFLSILPFAVAIVAWTATYSLL
jgi:hypothetical protein